MTDARQAARPEQQEGAGAHPARRALFLERHSYRRRRLMDGARLLPIFGIFLFLVPLLWPTGDADSAGIAPPSMSRAMLYLFACWALVVMIAAVFGRIVRGTDRGDPPGP